MAATLALKSENDKVPERRGQDDLAAYFKTIIDALKFLPQKEPQPRTTLELEVKYSLYSGNTPRGSSRNFSPAKASVASSHAKSIRCSVGVGHQTLEDLGAAANDSFLEVFWNEDLDSDNRRRKCPTKNELIKVFGAGLVSVDGIIVPSGQTASIQDGSQISILVKDSECGRLISSLILAVHFTFAASRIIEDPDDIWALSCSCWSRSSEKPSSIAVED